MEKEKSPELERFNRQVPNRARIPEVLHNTKPYTINLGAVHLPPYVVELHPGWDGEQATVRWTAPEAGTYRFRGYFIGLNQAPTTTDVHIFVGATAQIFEADVDSYGRPVAFDVVQSLVANDVIDFTVGLGRGKKATADSDSTGLAAWFTRL